MFQDASEALESFSNQVAAAGGDDERQPCIACLIAVFQVNFAA